MSTNDVATSVDISLAQVIPGDDFTRSTHAVQLYSDDTFLANELTRFIGTALAAGDATIVIATKAHHDALTDGLMKRGFDPAIGMKQGRLIILDAAETLTKFMVNGSPDPQRFLDLVGAMVLRAKMAAEGKNPRVAIFGEMVALLVATGNQQSAVVLEQLWNQLAQTHSFSLRCSYPVIGQERDGPGFAAICAEHTHVLPAESHSVLTAEEERFRSVAYQQQNGEAFHAMAEEHQRLAAALAVEVEDLRRLHEVATRLARADLPTMMQDVLSAVAALHNTDMGLFSLHAPERQELHVGASLGLPQDFLDCVAHVPAGSGSCGACLERRERVIIEDAETDPLFTSYVAWARAAGFRAVHSTPLLDGGGNVIGVISVHLRTSHRPSDREIQLTDLYASLAVNAMENARLYREAQSETAQRKQTEQALQDRIAELARAHAALIEAEKLAAAGRLAAAIAHEINNPLEGITNLSYLLRIHPSLTADAREYATACEQELRRVSHIVRQTLGFYRYSANPVPVCVSELVGDALALNAKRLESSHIEVREELEGCYVLGQEGEVRQIILNIMGNAIQALAKGGKLRLRVRASMDWRNPGNRGVRITIADSGSGIEAAYRHRIFEPFFSTKAEKGTGLGLWVTQGIVHKRHGSIRFRSRVGRNSGSSFTVFLPAEPR